VLLELVTKAAKFFFRKLLKRIITRKYFGSPPFFYTITGENAMQKEIQQDQKEDGGKSFSLTGLYDLIDEGLMIAWYV